MSLTIGERLGPYEVTGALGHGGMGEVFRARDTKLNRDVALKVLSSSVAGDPDRLARFHREAQVLGALNHPHIAQIYGLEDSGTTTALVMELVEGPTLEDAIRQHVEAQSSGVEVLEWAVPVARQIADALEAAHEQGVVHRDLKPANVKIRDDGTVKVLDFGLAKALDIAAGGPDGGGSSDAAALADSPTKLSPAMTAHGIIIGTAPYMSPEQARGRPVDKRADIWAFGVVFFEMLSGRRVFEGQTVSDTVAAVLRDPVPWERLPAETPARVRHVLERCLQRDPRKRLRDIGDARLDLDDDASDPVRSSASSAVGPVAAPSDASAPARSQPGARLAWAVAAVAVVAAIAAWVTRPATVATGSEWRHFTQLTDMSGPEDTPAISPDGASIAYARQVDGSWDLFTQRIGGRNPTVVAGDPARDERSPAFSPDSQWIAFHEGDNDGGLFVVGATGENARRVTEAGFHPAWSPDATRLAYCTEAIGDPHSRATESGIWVVDLETGDTRLIVNVDGVQPAWSPSGTRIAFWSAPGGQRDLYTVAAEGGEATPVIQDADLDWGVTWSPDGGYLYFASERGGTMSLWRVAIDEATGRALADPEPVVSGVQSAPELPSFSSDGLRMVFRSQQISVNPVALDVDPQTLSVGPPRSLMQRTGILIVTDVSPDGEWLALFNQGERQEDIFIARADGTDLRRLTNDAARDRVPRWAPDGRSLVFYSNRGGAYDAWRVNPDGSQLTQITEGGTAELGFLFPFYSPDGTRLYTGHYETGQLFELGLAGAVLPARPTELPPADVTVGGSEARARLSTAGPDGRLLAGAVLGPSGQPVGIGVYDVETGTARLVSDETETGPTFLPDGRRLLYVADGQLMVVDVSGGNRRVLTRDLPVGVGGTPVVSPDGRTIFVSGQVLASDIWMVERQR